MNGEAHPRFEDEWMWMMHPQPAPSNQAPTYSSLSKVWGANCRRLWWWKFPQNNQNEFSYVQWSHGFFLKVWWPGDGGCGLNPPQLGWVGACGFPWKAGVPPLFSKNQNAPPLVWHAMFCSISVEELCNSFLSFEFACFRKGFSCCNLFAWRP